MKNREKSLVKNTIILGIGKLLPKFIAIITLPIVTAQLTKAEFGTYDLLSTLIMLLLPIATLQIQSAAFRFLIDCRGNQEKSGRIITNILLVTIPISIIVSVFVVAIWKDMELLTKLFTFFYFISDITYITISQVTRGLSFNKEYSISSIIFSIINAIGILLVVKIKNFGLNGVIVSLFVANLVSIVYLSFKIKLLKYVNKKYISKNQTKEMLKYSWPMIPNNLSNWALKLSDRLVITGFLGIEANAVYAVANKIPNLLNIAQSIFVMAWQENASEALKDGNSEEYYSKMFYVVFKMMIGVTALLIAFTPVIFMLLIKGDYSGAYTQMPILILANFFYCMSAFQGGIYIAHKKTKSVGITTIVAAIINLLIDFIFIKKLGIAAGSISTLVAYFVLYIFRIIDVQNFQKMKLKIFKQIIFLALIVIMLIVCVINNNILNIFNIFFGSIICIYLNLDIIKIFMFKLKGKITHEK